MVLSCLIRLFGFGSHFTAPPGRDIDILILHHNCEAESIRAAIAIKAALKASCPEADVVMLSVAEEQDLQFINRSAARLLGGATAQMTATELAELCQLSANECR